MNISNYTIKQPIGQGGMATVYLANHQLLQNQVAIKVLSQEYVRNENIRKRFLAEARNMASMSHPNIIKVTDLIDDGDTVAFVMEHIEGETLKECLERKGKLSDDEIKTIFSQMLEAVGYVHEQKLVHRDIKPSNFMITSKGQIKLLDFGIAKNTDTNSADYTQTGTSQNMGTPMYMSPEQIKSTKDVTLQSDIYSLGVVLWQMVMGKKPYDTNTSSTYELQNKIVTENLSLTNSKFDSIIEVATAKELNIRFENCKAIKVKLDNLQNQETNNKKTCSMENSEKTVVDVSNEKTNVETPVKNIQITPHSINIYNTTLKQSNKIDTYNKPNSLLIHLMPGIIVLFLLTIDYYNWFNYFAYDILLSNFVILNYSLHGDFLIISLLSVCCGFIVFRYRYFKFHNDFYKMQIKKIWYFVPGLLMLVTTNYQFDTWEVTFSGDSSPIHYTFLNYSILPIFLLVSIVLLVFGFFIYLYKLKNENHK
jgi:serine/threonine protein kinase